MGGDLIVNDIDVSLRAHWALDGVSWASPETDTPAVAALLALQ